MVLCLFTITQHLNGRRERIFMIETITTWIMTLMKTNGPETVFLGVIIESIIVPIPSPLIIMGAGALIITPGLAWNDIFVPIMMKIVLPGAAASTLGSFFMYGIAYWGGKPMIERLRKFLGFGWIDVLRMEKRLMGRVGLMIFLLRAIPIVPLSLISAGAGVLRLPVGKFILWTFAGSVPRCLILAYLGYLTRNTYEGLAEQINSMESLLSAGLILSVAAVVVWIRLRWQRKNEQIDRQIASLPSTE
jgi:membrane protein DedA with SNARE-associated domain